MSPAPEAAEPYVTDEPGNLVVTFWSTPLSVAGADVSRVTEREDQRSRTAVTRTEGVARAVVGGVALLRSLRVEVTLGLLRELQWVLAFVFCRHGVGDIEWVKLK